MRTTASIVLIVSLICAPVHTRSSDALLIAGSLLAAGGVVGSIVCHQQQKKRNRLLPTRRIRQLKRLQMLAATSSVAGAVCCLVGLLADMQKPLKQEKHSPPHQKPAAITYTSSLKTQSPPPPKPAPSRPPISSPTTPPPAPKKKQPAKPALTSITDDTTAREKESASDAPAIPDTTPKDQSPKLPPAKQPAPTQSPAPVQSPAPQTGQHPSQYTPSTPATPSPHTPASPLSAPKDDHSPPSRTTNQHDANPTLLPSSKKQPSPPSLPPACTPRVVTPPYEDPVGRLEKRCADLVIQKQALQQSIDEWDCETDDIRMLTSITVQVESMTNLIAQCQQHIIGLKAHPINTNNATPTTDELISSADSFLSKDDRRVRPDAAVPFPLLSPLPSNMPVVSSCQPAAPQAVKTKPYFGDRQPAPPAPPVKNS